MSKVVIMMGGPTKGTRFRPLSLEIAKPLFPIAGSPMIQHHINAAVTLPDLQEILLIGFYKESVLEKYISSVSSKLSIKIRYLRETEKFGSAGGLLHFKKEILKDEPKKIFILHCDICCDFPLVEMSKYHDEGQAVTMLVAQVPREHSQMFGCVVGDADGTIQHYAARPEGYISDIINAGVYCATPELFDFIAKAKSSGPTRTSLMISYDRIFSTAPDHLVDFEKDVIIPLTGTGKLKMFQNKAGFWRQIKNAGAALYANALYLDHAAKSKKTGTKPIPGTIGNVDIHPSAVIHSTARIGPNVSIGANVVVGAGARLVDCIVREDALIKENACIITAIVDKGTTIGQWARIQGIANTSPFLYIDPATKARVGVCIIGAAAKVKPEVLVYNCVVMPHKGISYNVKNRIVL